MYACHQCIQTHPRVLKEIRIIRLFPEVAARFYQVNVIYQISKFGPWSSSELGRAWRAWKSFDRLAAAASSESSDEMIFTLKEKSLIKWYSKTADIDGSLPHLFWWAKVAFVYAASRSWTNQASVFRVNRSFPIACYTMREIIRKGTTILKKEPLK